MVKYNKTGGLIKMRDREYNKSEINPAIKRFIKRLEKEHNRVCRKIWSFTNPNGEQFLFGSFCRNYDRLYITLGAYNSAVSGGFLPPL